MDSVEHSIFCGIDVSKASFDYCIIQSANNQKLIGMVSNSKFDYDKFIATLNNYPKERLLIVMESTSIYHLNIYRRLKREQFHVYVVNPLLIFNFHRSMSLRKTKTDKKDAYIIALFGMKRQEVLENVFNELKP